MKIFSFTGDDSSPLPANVRISAAGFGDGQPAGELTGLLQLRDIEPSWAGGSIQLTLFRPSGAVTGGVIAEDAVSLLSPEREYGDRISMVGRIMLPQGITHLILHIDPMLTTQGNRAFDFSRIREFTLNLGASVDAPVYVRHLRICAEHDAVGAPVIPAPGDSISCLQNQNQSCYTYLLEEVKPTAEIHGLQQQLQRNMARLRQAIRVSQMGGRQTLYAEAVELVADIALTARRLYPWTNDDDWRRQDLTDGLRLVGDHITELDAFARGMVHADDEDDSNIPVPAVPDLPVLSSLRIDGNTFVDGNGRPTVLYAMNYHHHGPLLKFFAPDDHRVESYAAGGGSRYDIEWSPVYRTHQQNESARRVGWRGWCGHLIKDQWAMGGRKENVVICMESDAVRAAVRQYNNEHVHEWRHAPNLLYNIVQYELMYMCYCAESIAMYHAWLAQKYGGIEVLNAAWGEQFVTMAQIVPPAAPDGVPDAATNRAAWFDWTCWNTRRFTDILLWARNNIRELDGDVAICAGGTSSMTSAANGTSGIDEELIINELDDVILHEGSNLLSLDLLRALADTPKPVVDPEFGGSAYDVFKGFLHGKSTIAKFWWPKQPSRCYPQMTLRAPMQGRIDLDEVYEHLRVALDVRRLGVEIASFWNLPASVAIHYSKSSILQVPYALLKAKTTPYLSALTLTYNAASRLDTPVTFISERQLLHGKAGTFRIVILPAVQ
ncbi:MAG: beta-galactosidase, partial [bacterium]|nr:beta-galactosidase [bacterium]